MVSPEATATVNEIMRKIKLYKAKRTSFADVARKKKEELLTERMERVKREKLLVREQSTPMSTAVTHPGDFGTARSRRSFKSHIISEAQSTKVKSPHLQSVIRMMDPADTAYTSKLLENQERTRNGAAMVRTDVD